jgi:hypothetical protein
MASRKSMSKRERRLHRKYRVQLRLDGTLELRGTRRIGRW